MPDQNTVPLHATVLPQHKEMLERMAREQGMTGMSEALRRILQEVLSHTSIRVTEHYVRTIGNPDPAAGYEPDPFEN